MTAANAIAATAAVRADTHTADHAGRWHLSVHFGADTFRNGMDPLAILNYVRGLGAIPRLACDLAGVPSLEAIDPESCHLGFEFSLDTAASREEIESAFSFVRDDCTLHLIEPEGTPTDFAALIEAMPDNPRLGDILIAVGAITRGQLQQALTDQRIATVTEGIAPPLGEILQAKSGLSPQVVSAALNKQNKQREGGCHHPPRATTTGSSACMPTGSTR